MLLLSLDTLLGVTVCFSQDFLLTLLLSLDVLLGDTMLFPQDFSLTLLLSFGTPLGACACLGNTVFYCQFITGILFDPPLRHPIVTLDWNSSWCPCALSGNIVFSHQFTSGIFGSIIGLVN